MLSQWESETLFYRGRFIQILFTRNHGGGTLGVEVRDFETFSLIMKRPWDGVFGCAIVLGDTIHIFGRVVKPDGLRAILHATISEADGWEMHDLGYAWTFTSTQNNVFNLGITASPFGYRMAVEWIENGNLILASNDLSTFTLDTHIRSGMFTGTPQPYWFGGRFYLTYLNRIPGGPQGSLFCTVALRTDDETFAGSLIPSAKVLLFPDHFDTDSISMGDFSAAEHNGEVAFSFSADDQGLGGPLFSALRQGYYKRGGVAALMAELF
jgi:hypothetical protein